MMTNKIMTADDVWDGRSGHKSTCSCKWGRGFGRHEKTPSHAKKNELRTFYASSTSFFSYLLLKVQSV